MAIREHISDIVNALTISGLELFLSFLRLAASRWLAND